MAVVDISNTYQLTNVGAHIDNTDVYNSNMNLLDNPWFTVNQRGASGTISTANQFGADRWKKSGGSGSVIVGDGYFTPVGGGGYRQLNPWNKIISGRTYTVSAMTADGNVYSATGVLSSTTSGWQISSHLIPNSLWVGVQNNGGNLDILFTGQNGDIQVIAVKLELGTVSTLANDAPPDFGEELRKCQRYLFIRDYAQNDIIANGLTNNLTMFLPASMRSGGSPIMTFTVTPHVIGNGVISTPTSVNLVSVNGNQVQIYAPTTESHNAQAIVLYAGSATRMTIANEL